MKSSVDRCVANLSLFGAWVALALCIAGCGPSACKTAGGFVGTWSFSVVDASAAIRREWAKSTVAAEIAAERERRLADFETHPVSGFHLRLAPSGEAGWTYVMPGQSEVLGRWYDAGEPSIGLEFPQDGPGVLPPESFRVVWTDMRLWLEVPGPLLLPLERRSADLPFK